MRPPLRPKLQDQRGAGFGLLAVPPQCAELQGAQGVIGHREQRLLRLIHQRCIGVKTQVLADQIVAERTGEPDWGVVVHQRQQYAGGGRVERRPTVLPVAVARQ